MTILEDTYSRISYAVVNILVTVYWPKLVRQERNWATVVFVVFGGALMMFFDAQIRRIPKGRCDAVKIVLQMVANLFSILLAYFIGIAIVGLFEEDTGNDPSLNSVYKPLLVMLALAVLMGLMKILEFYRVPEDDHRR